MRRLVTWAAVIVAAIVVLAIAAVLVVPHLVDTPRVQSLIASSFSHALGRPVRFASISVSVLPRPAVDVHGLEVAEDPAFGASPFLKLDRAQLNLRVRPLLGGHVEFGDLVLKQPIVSLVEDARGRWNISTLGQSRDAGAPARSGRTGGGGGAGAAALGSRIRIEGATVTLERREAAGAPSKYRLEDVNLTLSGGAGAPGPLVFQGDARLRPGDLKVKITDGSVALNGGRPLGDAAVRAHVGFESKDLKDLAAVAVGPEPAVAGNISGALTLGGTVGKPKATGEAAVTPLAVTRTTPTCPDPKQRTLTLASVKLPVAWDAGRLSVRPLTAELAGGTITATLLTAPAQGPRVDLRDVTVRALPLEKVLVDFLCQGYAVSGPLDLTGSFALDPADIWRTLSGAGQLKMGPGKVVGSQALALLGSAVRVGGAVSSLLGGDLPPSLFSAPLGFDSITGSFQAAAGVITTRDLLYTSRLVKVTLAGDYALASGRMNFDVALSSGRGQVAAKVTGTAASPSVRVAPESVLRNVNPGQVERGLQDLLKRFR